ncbi:hypothetical protein PMI06_008745 [Burkholderia sp. BT03]|nr:hypothetical protein PMI06_008745 [Burkholderia sp. BT03]
MIRAALAKGLRGADCTGPPNGYTSNSGSNSSGRRRCPRSRCTPQRQIIPKVFSNLKKMTPFRQIEGAEMMVAANKAAVNSVFVKQIW